MLQNEDGNSDTDSDSDFDNSNSLAAPSSLSVPPIDPLMRSLQDQDDPGTGSDSSLGRKEKARRRNLNKEDLLFNDVDVPSFNAEMLMLPPKPLPPSTNSRIPRNVGSLNVSSVPFSRSLSFTRANNNPMGCKHQRSRCC